MDNPGKGGRGKRAPYNTVPARVPQPIKSLAEELSAKYRELVTDYENPDDPVLIAAVKDAMATPAAGIGPGNDNENALQDAHHQLKTVKDYASHLEFENERTKQLLQEYEQMQAEMDSLKKQVKKLKSTNSKDKTFKAVIDFIEYKKSVYVPKNAATFSLNTRGWDAFRDFMQFINQPEKLQSLNGWKVGDKCSVKMPSGIIITDAEVASIEPNGNCKISVPSTNSHFPSDLQSLIRE